MAKRNTDSYHFPRHVIHSTEQQTHLAQVQNLQYEIQTLRNFIKVLMLKFPEHESSAKFSTHLAIEDLQKAENIVLATDTIGKNIKIEAHLKKS